ncbi:hypothetical protein [Motilibacter aurantiacus]|nr:hypothetical protein [Motilibacter aurantiacus]NHC45807.1 hypothetical protein [Motilibacter aurantiacus]
MRGREVYLRCTGSSVRTALGSGLPRGLSATATTRSWNTVRRLEQLARG